LEAGTTNRSKQKELEARENLNPTKEVGGGGNLNPNKKELEQPKSKLKS
jgi:hypothetical protein